MGFGDSIVKKMRSRPLQVIAVSLVTIAGSHPIDPVQATEIADPIAGAALVAQSSEQLRLYVDPAIGRDQTGDGSRDRPFQTITHALDRAHPNTIVVLAPGTYSEASGEQFPIQLRSGVTVYGDPERWGDEIEIVGGGWLMTPTAGEQSVAILGFDGAGLSGVTVRNPDGSGIWVAGGMPWIVGNTIAENDRHGIVAHDGTPYIINNRFDDNDGSDLELSDRAMPQLEDNQLDRRNTRSISYFITETGPTIGAANPSGRSPASSSVTSEIRSNERSQAEPAEFTEVVTWQGETSFPPIVRPSETIAARPPAMLDPIVARSLPIDPDLAIVTTPTPTLGNRVNTVRSNPAPETTSAAPVRTSNQRLPAAPNVPIVTASTTSNTARDTTNRSTIAPIVAWGTPTAANTSETAPTPNTPDTLLRWEALERSRPVVSNGLPAPIVNPINSIPSNSGLNSNPSSIVIASQSADALDTSSTNPTHSPTRTPIPIQASIEPFNQTSLPLAYAPSNVAPAWPQPRPAGIPGLVPLPVPDPNPPIGEGGAVPPPPSSTVNLSEPSSGLLPATMRSGLRYRVLVEDSANLDRVLAIADHAFVSQSDGREVIQAGVFGDRWRADQLVTEFTAAGLTAWVLEF